MNIKNNYESNKKTLMVGLNIVNPMALPKIEKVVVNIGVGKTREQANLLDLLTKDLATITGQKPIVTRAKKAIAGFKVQKNQPVGLKVTLRKNRMYAFIDRLVNVVFPAIRDFKGVDQKNIDSQGNLNIGISEHILFPEIGFEQSSRAHGLQLTIVAKSANRENAIALYKSIGFPLKEQK